MCGRYHIDSGEDIDEIRELIDEINRRFTGTEQLAAMKTGEVFPTNTVPILSAKGPDLMQWGYPMNGSSKTIINARSETVYEKPIFRTAVNSRRIVVPTSGFYEWTHDEKGKAKDKFLFRLPHEDMLYLAGFFTLFDMPTGAEARFTILTAAANHSMRPYHNRMPVFIGRDERELWIGDSAFTEEALRRAQPELVPTRMEKLGQMSLFS